MNIDKDTAHAIKHNAPGLARISGERIWMEMSKILIGNNPSQILKEMNELDVLLNIGLVAHDFSQASRLAEFQNPILVLASMIAISEVAKLHARWKFTNEQFSELQFLTKFKDVKLTEELAQDMVINGTKGHWVVDLLLLQNQKGIAAKIHNWKAPVFPVTGQDLMTHGFKQGPELGQALQRMKKEWIKSRFTLSREELLKHAYNIDKKIESLK